MTITGSDTIAAVATPRGAGGIAIIKISGPDALLVLERIFRPARRHHGRRAAFDHQRIYYGHVVHPEDGVLDEVLVTIMKAPQSYTTEDVVEINCHGGALVTREILDLVVAQGARVADPGEFTRRAFMGGRISLAQAESVIDLINAKTRRAQRAGLQQLMYGVDLQVQDLLNQLTTYLAEIEAYLDFDDDLEETIALTPLGDYIQQEMLPTLEGLIDSYRESRLLNDGLRVVIAGRPNVGKSSLANRLLNQDRVIVTAQPGTTRDTIEETIAIDGTPVVITDTAGIHGSTDPIEALGIERSREAIRRADLVLLVIDSTGDLQAEDIKIYNEIKYMSHIVIPNKIDLVAVRPSPADFQPIDPLHLVAISALTGEGIDDLKQHIVACTGLDRVPEDGTVLVNLRQRQLLEATQAHIQRAAAFLGRDVDTELAAVEINDAIRRLGEILGQDVAPDVLDHIFRRFCIGK
jgi:tRNA modification GTPase